MTTLVLAMVHLVPASVLEGLEEQFGRAFRELAEPQRLSMALAAHEGSVTHRRLHELLDDHSRDLTLALHGLVQNNMLQSQGSGRHTTYTIPHQGHDDGLNDVGSRLNDVGSPGNDAGSEPAIIHRVASAKRVKGEALRRAILLLYATEFVSPDELALRLNREVRNLQYRFLRPMVRDGLLTLAHPDRPSHPRQAYRAATREDAR